MDLMLAYRDLAGWNDVIRLVASFPPPLAQSPTVVQQKALAFNRSGLTGGATRAERALRELLERIGPDSETYGLLGRIYKDRYQRTSSRADLDRAIDAYRQGWLIDHRDIYPGINLATLLTLAGDAGAAQEEARQVVAELREIVDPRIDDAPADYWDVATGVELAALGRDWVRAGQLVEAARVRAAAAWMIESTANNLQILREAMPDPRDRGKMDQLIRDLAPEAASS
jgi:tetratricopeptide (TPR) repeat protein